MRTVLLSDLHLASGGAIDLLRRPELREVLWEKIRAPTWSCCWVTRSSCATGRFRRPSIWHSRSSTSWARRSAPARWSWCPGTTTTTCSTRGWTAGGSRDGTPGTGAARPGRLGPLARLAAGMGRTSIELAYPGIWLRPGIYATHGHYVDRHLTVPTFERLAVAAVERVLGGSREVTEEPGSPGGAGSATADDYERIQAPVYAFLFALAQAGSGGRLAGASPSVRVWQALGGGYGRAAKLRGWLLGTVAVPGAVGVANRLGLGPVRSDLSPGAITAAGLAAIGEVTRRLDIDADHLIFGHTHRRGPMRAETGWRMPEGTRLWNTGSWVYAPGWWAARQRTAPTGRAPSPSWMATAHPSSTTCSTTVAGASCGAS